MTHNPGGNGSPGACYIYIFYSRQQGWIKIGITNGLKRRLNQIKKEQGFSDYKIIYKHLFSSREEALSIEQLIHRESPLRDHWTGKPEYYEYPECQEALRRTFESLGLPRINWAIRTADRPEADENEYYNARPVSTNHGTRHKKRPKPRKEKRPAPHRETIASDTLRSTHAKQERSQPLPAKPAKPVTRRPRPLPQIIHIDIKKLTGIDLGNLPALLILVPVFSAVFPAIFPLIIAFSLATTGCLGWVVIALCLPLALLLYTFIFMNYATLAIATFAILLAMLIADSSSK